MGDYNYGVTTTVRTLSPTIDYQQTSATTSLFYPGSEMQDELLLEKNQKQLNENSDEKSEEVVNGQNDKKVTTETSTSVTASSPLQQFGFTEPSTTASNFWSTDDAFLQGLPVLNGQIPFQNITANSILNTNLSNQILPQPQRRAITGAHNFSQNRQPNLYKTYANWSNPTWTTSQTQNTLSAWNNQKRSVPNLNPISPLKKSPPAIGQPSMLISPSKFQRSTSLPIGKPFPHNIPSNTGYDVTNSEDIRDGNVMLPYQDRQLSNSLTPSPLDTLRFPLEQQLLDIMRGTTENQDHYKGFINYNPNNLHSMAQLPGSSLEFSIQKCNGNKKCSRGKSPFFTTLDENHLIDDGHLDQIVPSLNSSLHCSPKSQAGSEAGERYSRKVFVGGLPPDIDEDEITSSFRRFGPLVVDWPHKAESKSYFPPKGYAFLLFQDESSVQALIDACIQEEDKLYLCVSSPTIKDKPVQIRPWRLSDADFVLDASMPLDPRKTVFVGGVPRPLKAVELAMIMDRLYGGVCYAGIDTDPELKYPKGAGRVAFSNQQSYIAAISARFVQLQHGDIEKRVEVKPYVLDDQMCDECQGARCGGKFAPFFCANVTCLQYYCEHCWATIHSRPGREFHKPLVKEGADRPRAVPFRWC
ncbi:cytoplasmic polyadenylation element-binding protein 2-like isoform X2 [Centruroides vittatus]|uniref:cytoplasmic polyadenylation element-binding protein 2-like isoform X2 n=1 Tax=Centruroides vittatus TaxID=120091 RepID=UPI00350EA0FF